MAEPENSPAGEVPPPAPGGEPPTDESPDSTGEATRDQRQASGGESKWLERLIGVGILLVVVLGVVYGVVNNAWKAASGDVDIIASARRDETPPAGEAAATEGWTIEGRIFDGGQAVENAIVSAVVTDARGHQFAPDPVASAADGKFTLHFTIGKVSGEGLLHPVASIVAKKKVTGWSAGTREGRSNLSLTGSVQPPIIRNSPWAFALVAVWFVASFVFAIAAVASKGPRERLYYYLSVTLTCTMSIVIIWTFYWAVSELADNPAAAKGEVIVLGFVNIYKGSYLTQGPEEMIVSLSAPPTVAPLTTVPQPAGKPNNSGGEVPMPPASAISPSPASSAPVGRTLAAGFGAPLWVIVISVIGATLLTVTMILQEIETPPDFTPQVGASAGAAEPPPAQQPPAPPPAAGAPPAADDKPVVVDLRKRTANIVAHQLFMLFAPLGGIFLYQTLLAAKAAEQPLAVATAALGAGASLNYLLAKAVEVTRGLLNK